MNKNRVFELKNNLKKIRFEKGLSQIELAKLANTSQNLISQIENGVHYPSLAISMSICKALGVSVEECFYLDGLKEKETESISRNDDKNNDKFDISKIDKEDFNHLFLKNRVKEVRLKKGLSQTELAKLCETTQNTISSIENCIYGPSSYLAYKICQGLECTFDDVFYLEVDRSKSKKK